MTSDTDRPARRPQRDDRKSAALAARNVAATGDARVVTSFALARDILRSTAMLQAGVGGDQLPIGNPDHASVFFLDGEAHRRKRSAIARYFTPKAINGRYRQVMETTTARLLEEFRAVGRAQLDDVSFELAVTVAADIVGLTESDQAAMAGRISRTLAGVQVPLMRPWLRPYGQLRAAASALRFFVRDVRPAIVARRAQHREDVISHLLDEGYRNREILIECMTYAVAGMVTTREFIVMAAWHLFDDDKLFARFRTGDEEDQLAILTELLRLEPVASTLRRRASGEVAFPTGQVHDGELVSLSVRQANLDERSVGECPFAIDPDRARMMPGVGTYLSFGDGSHRCPGAQVALHETRVFLDQLVRVPGIQLERAPDMTWNPALESYELRRAIVSCDRS